MLLCFSVLILRGLRIVETPPVREQSHFWHDMREGLRFVGHQHLLVMLAAIVGLWQFCQNTAMVVQILFATRELGLNERQVGLCYIGLGLGTTIAGLLGNRLSRRIGPGPCLLWGIAICGAGWLLLAFAPANAWGVAALVAMLLCFSCGAVLVFINFLALRQAVTPQHLLGRMTSTMRWLILLPAAPGALLGGWLGEQFGLRYALGAGGVAAIVLALWGWRQPVLRNLRTLPLAPHP